MLDNQKSVQKKTNWLSTK